MFEPVPERHWRDTILATTRSPNGRLAAEAQRGLRAQFVGCPLQVPDTDRHPSGSLSAEKAKTSPTNLVKPASALQPTFVVPLSRNCNVINVERAQLAMAGQAVHPLSLSDALPNGRIGRGGHLGAHQLAWNPNGIRGFGCTLAMQAIDDPGHPHGHLQSSGGIPRRSSVMSG